MPALCIHEWHTIGIGPRIMCSRCRVQGTVTIDPKPINYLEVARAAWDKSCAPGRTMADSNGFRADALGAVIQHLEEKETP